MGAGSMNAGESAVHTHMTNSWNTPVETLEHQYPVRIRKYGIRSRSGGDGEHAGGDGIIRPFEFLTSEEVTILSSRRAKGAVRTGRRNAGEAGPEYSHPEWPQDRGCRHGAADGGTGRRVGD